MKERQTNHRIFSELLTMIENRQVSSVESGEGPLSWTDETARSYKEAGFTDEQIAHQMKMCSTRILIVQKDMPQALYRKLTKFDPVKRERIFTNEEDEKLLFRNQVVCIPGEILNIVICSELRARFTRSELLTCPGFVEREGSIWLDLDPALARRGFLMPVIENGLIRNLRVFRYPEDARPFILRSRTLEVALYA